MLWPKSVGPVVFLWFSLRVFLWFSLKFCLRFEPAYNTMGWLSCFLLQRESQPRAQPSRTFWSQSHRFWRAAPTTYLAVLDGSTILCGHTTISSPTPGKIINPWQVPLPQPYQCGDCSRSFRGEPHPNICRRPKLVYTRCVFREPAPTALRSQPGQTDWHF